ncbi:MAG TPA: YsnF/AvaK domain-containing protein [Myxococcaceae bacterium]|nr:YsnF/AvaK domain-containing protein [Myxococcaceae bacterium]
MIQASDIHEGMVVRAADGKRVGRVLFVEELHFIVERGLWTPRDYRLDMRDVAGVVGRELHLVPGCELPVEKQGGVLRRLRDFLGLGAREQAVASDSAVAREGVHPARGAVRADEAQSGKTVASEPSPGVATAPSAGVDFSGEMAAGLQVRGSDAGASGEDEAPAVSPGGVQVKKEVITERKQLEVPLRHERIRVERRAVPPQPAPEATFEEEVQYIQLQAEEAEITKRPVVTEHVLVQKERVVAHHVDEREISSGVTDSGDVTPYVGPDER